MLAVNSEIKELSDTMLTQTSRAGPTQEFNLGGQGSCWGSDYDQIFVYIELKVFLNLNLVQFIYKFQTKCLIKGGFMSSNFIHISR